jgi:hypothetical protein
MKVLGSSKFSHKVKRRREGEGEEVPCLDHAKGPGDGVDAILHYHGYRNPDFNSSRKLFLLSFYFYRTPCRLPRRTQHKSHEMLLFTWYAFQNIGEYQQRKQKWRYFLYLILLNWRVIIQWKIPVENLFLCNQKITGVLGPKSFPGSVGRNEEQ